VSAGVYLGFDFGYKRIGVAVGQLVTCSAKPLKMIPAKEGIPDWQSVAKLIAQWLPQALIVGLPTCIDGKEQYTTVAAREFAAQLADRFKLPVHLVDERLTTVEARAEMFAQGGYRKIKSASIDSVAACIILEQWLNNPQESL
jgi:putative Holliday junction resolvase